MAAQINVQIQDFQTKLRKKGWNISNEGIEECLQELEQGEKNVESIAKWAVNCDMKEFGCKVLKEEVKRGQVPTVEGPVVLQIQKIRNISAPKANEESGAAPRLLKLQLSDGHTTCFGLENSLIQKLSLSTPPGTKIRLKGTVPLLCGFMLLEPRHVEILGGKVEKLVLKWETNKNVSQQRAKPGLPSDDGPPLFIKFDPKTICAIKKSSSKLDRQNPPIKSSQGSETSQKEENKKVHEAFEQNRDQRIQTAKESNEKQSNPTKASNNTNKVRQVAAGTQGTRRVSPSDGDKKHDESRSNIKPNIFQGDRFGHNQNNDRNETFSNKSDGQRYIEKRNHEKRPGSYKGGRNNDDTDDLLLTSRPSDGTLWDFLETKLSSKGNKTENDKANNREDDHFQKVGNEDIPAPKSRTNCQYKNRRPNYQHERRDQVQNKERNEGGRKGSIQSRNEIGNEKNHERQTNDEQVKQYSKQRESKHNQYSKERTQEREGNNDERDNQRNTPLSRTTRGEKQNKPSEIRHTNQSGQGGQNRKTIGERNNQKRENYRRDNAKNAQSDHRQPESAGSTRKPAHAVNRIPNTESDSYKDEKKSGVIHVTSRQRNTENDVPRNSDGTGERSKNPQRLRRKQKEYHGGNPQVDKRHNRDIRDVSNKKQKDENKREEKDSYENECKFVKETSGNGVSDQSARTEEMEKRDKQTKKGFVGQSDGQKYHNQSASFGRLVPEGRDFETRKQHWWKEGEHCTAYHVELRQYYPARIVKVEVRLRSCVVMFPDTGRQETISWSNLVPSDVQQNRERSHPISRHPIPNFSPVPIHYSWMPQQGSSFTPRFNQARPSIPGDPAAQHNTMRERSQRPTQAFYTPPSTKK